jgi:hypothetical protein
VQRQLRELLAEMRGMRGANGLDHEKFEQFRAALDGMEADEILAVLKELDASDASQSDKVGLANYIAGSLARKDPRLALDTFVGRLSGSPSFLLGQLGVIYSRWAQTDLANAVEWFDEKVASGSLAVVTGAGDMKIDPRVYFESQLVRALAGKNGVEAGARFEAMPEDVREKVLGDDWFSSASPQRAKAVAEFLREHSGGRDLAEVIAKAASTRVRQGDLGYVAQFLSELEPAEGERAAIVGEALRVRLTNQDQLAMTPQEAREWIMAQAPQDAGRLTGTMLAQMVEWLEFPEMSKLALKYREESGSDEVLVAFLKGAPVSAKDEIVKLAGEIKDPAVRAEVAGRFEE